MACFRPAVVTPHPGEAARLLGMSAAEIQADRVGAVQRLIELCGTHVVLKGAHTLIGLPSGDIYLCPDGNAGMATAGSGDVLAGVIGGMLAVGHEIDRAVVAGLFGMLAQATGLKPNMVQRAYVRAG